MSKTVHHHERQRRAYSRRELRAVSKTAEKSGKMRKDQGSLDVAIWKPVVP